VAVTAAAGTSAEDSATGQEGRGERGRPVAGAEATWAGVATVTAVAAARVLAAGEASEAEWAAG